MLGLWAALALSAAASDVRWHNGMSPHFEVAHEAPWLPAGFMMSLEKMHSRLRLDLAMFSPWMARERVKLFVYAGKESYLGGRFSPPSWSNGVALYRQRTVAVYRQRSRTRLLEVIAHETAHLLFESYWGERSASPPAWLNEGLAMVEEGEAADRAERSGWYQAMLELPQAGFLPLGRFFAIAPTVHIADDAKAVETWYVQAYSIVHFLLRRANGRLQFRNFCSELRDGRAIEAALWSVYRYRGLKQFEQAWLAWLREPAHRERISASFEREAGEKPPPRIGTISGFKPLRRSGGVEDEAED